MAKLEGDAEVVKKEDLWLFYSLSDKFQSVILKCKCINSIIVIGQEVESLEGLEALHTLEELWIVNCQLEQKCVGPLSACLKLKRLYLYGNQLTEIPDLRKTNQLTHLWLSDNQIETFKDINCIAAKELNLSNNNISRIDLNFKSKLKTECLNLSGNPILSFKEIEKLSVLRELRWLLLSDPLFKPTPVSLLAGYHYHTIHCLPGLERLDATHITELERKQISEIYENKVQFCRLTLHNSLAELLASHKSGLDKSNKDLEVIWSALHSHGPPQEKTADDKNSNLQFWEGEAQKWKEKKGIINHNYKKMAEVFKRKTQLELEYSGNIQIGELDLEECKIVHRLKEKIDSFLCPQLKSKVLGVNLLNVWSIRGSYQTTIVQSQFKESFDEVYILHPVQNLDVHLLETVEDLLFGGKPKGELELARCLATADELVRDSAWIHRQLLLRSQTLLTSRLLLLCGIPTDSQLPCQAHVSHHLCGSLPYNGRLVPLYLVHFQYNFQDYFGLLRASVPASREGTPNPKCSVLPTVTKNLTKLVLAGANLHQLDLPVMEQVTFVDLSYNHLQDISCLGSVFPLLTSLDLAFNKINSLDGLQGMKTLTNLVVSWNFLADFFDTLNKLKKLPSLKLLDLRWNPFRNISNEHEATLVRKRLQNLDCYMPLSQSLISRPPKSLQHFPKAQAWRGLSPSLSVLWKSEMSNFKGGNHLGVVGKNVVSVAVKNLGLTEFISDSGLPLGKVKYLDLSDNLISCLEGVKLPSLQELNISHNVLLSFSGVKNKFKNLTKLNLSHNYLTSLSINSSKSFPQLIYLDLSDNRMTSLSGVSRIESLQELYLSHNLLSSNISLTPLKSLGSLRVLDVSHNPLVLNSTFRMECLSILSNLEYLNGTRVQSEEKKSAQKGVLDDDYLTRLYTKSSLDILTRLSLCHCSFNKVMLSATNLTHLTSLILDDNVITYLSWVQFLPSLSSLSLSNNSVCGYFADDVTIPPPSSPTPSTSLCSLVLQGNRVRNLAPLCLHLFPCLTKLDLAHNNISSLSGLSSSKLEVLILNGNKLSSISIGQAEKLLNLEALYLESNSLTKLDFLRPLKKIRKLFVGYNKLVARACFEPLRELPELEELTVHRNPVCRHRSYWQYLPPLPKLKRLEGHPLPCSTPTVSE